jgi:hypothetical protein
MSDTTTEIATTSEFIKAQHKLAKESMRHNRAICVRSPSQWMLVARHVMEDGLHISDFLKANKITRNVYFDIRLQLIAGEDFDKVRENAALDAAVDYEMGVDLERKYSEKMHEKMEDGTLEIDAQGYAQINRGQSMKADRLHKFAGTETQKIIVEHKTTLDEAAAFALEAIKNVTEVEAEEI